MFKFLRKKGQHPSHIMIGGTEKTHFNIARPQDGDVYIKPTQSPYADIIIADNQIAYDGKSYKSADTKCNVMSYIAPLRKYMDSQDGRIAMTSHSQLGVLAIPVPHYLAYTQIKMASLTDPDGYIVVTEVEGIIDASVAASWLRVSDAQFADLINDINTRQ